VILRDHPRAYAAAFRASAKTQEYLAGFSENKWAFAVPEPGNNDSNITAATGNRHQRLQLWRRRHRRRQSYRVGRLWHQGTVPNRSDQIFAMRSSVRARLNSASIIVLDPSHRLSGALGCLTNFNQLARLLV
jgi:hypothetical protein